MKKLLAILLAVAMLLGVALVASAAETSIADLDCSGWWTTHSDGIEVTEEGVTVTFTATTYESATDNWQSAIIVVYSGDEGKVNGSGYSEYWVHRIDQYGWCVAGQYYNVDLNRWSGEDALAAYGITATSVDSRTDGWANFLTDLKAGVECTLTAKLEGANCVMTLDANGIYSTMILPVDTSKTTYISLSGQDAVLSNIKVTTPDPVVDEPVDTEPAEDDVTVIYTGSEAYTGWKDVFEIYTNLWGGTLDSGFIAENGYLIVNFSIEDVSQLWQVRLSLNGTQWTEIDWHVDAASWKAGTLTDLGNGNYSVTYTYDEIVAIYGSNDFAGTLGAVYVSTNGGAPITVTSVTYTVPADKSNPKSGDSISLVLALLAVSAAGIAVISKKKEF